MYIQHRVYTTQVQKIMHCQKIKKKLLAVPLQAHITCAEQYLKFGV